MRNLILYYLLSAIRELGVNLPLLFRRVSQLAMNDISYLSQTFFQGKIEESNFESIVKSVAQIMEQEKLVEKMDILKLSNEEIEFEVTGCEYLHLVSEARIKGEKECPLCLVALAGAIAASAGGVSVHGVETSTDLDAKKCKVKLQFVKV